MHTLIIKTFLLQAINFSQLVLIRAIQFSISIDFLCILLNVTSVLFQTIQLRVVQFQSQKLFYYKQCSLA